MAKWNTDNKSGYGIFSTLGKIFSTGVLIRNVGGKDSTKLQVIDTYSQQAMGNLATNYVVSRYSNIAGGSFNSQQYSYTNMPITQQRIWLFRDYEMMDQDAILSAALDIYGEEVCVQNDYGNVLNIQTEDGEIKEVLENLFFDIMDVNKNLYFWTRTCCKYGDWFLKLDLAERLGVTQSYASFFGGTSLLIMVSVVLDTLQQVETYLLMRKYDGLMGSGRIKGRQTTSMPSSSVI